LLDAVPAGMSPLQIANSLSEFEWLIRHPLFPAGLLEGLFCADGLSESRTSSPGGEPASDQVLRLAFADFARGYQVEQGLAAEWQHARTIAEEAERRLTEYLNRHATYALRTFAVHLEMNSNPECTDAIRMRRMLGELEGEEGELLDIGCAFVPLAERYAGMRRWVGLDLSLPALAIGRIVNQVPVECLVCAYSEDLPLPNQSFDVVVSSEVLEHTPRPRRMVAEIARVLRVGGKAILSVPQHIVDFQDGRQDQIGATDSTHRFHFHTLQELQTLFEEHGLSVERLQADPHYIFTLRRIATGDPPSQTASDSQVPFVCPDCHGPLQTDGPMLTCAACAVQFVRRDGVPVLLPRRLRSARLDQDGLLRGKLGGWANGAGFQGAEQSL
jgi:SAM-dependent methyltransferase